MVADVQSAFTVRGAAWWDVTGQYDRQRNPESVEEALEWAGAQWEPVGTPVFHGKESHKCESITACENLAVAKVKFTNPQGEQDIKYACGLHANQAQSKGYPTESLPLKQLPNYYAVTRSDTNDVLHVANSTYELFTNRETAELVELLLDSKAVDGGVQFETGGVLKGGRLVWFLARLDAPVEVPGDTSPIYPYISVLNSHDGTAALRAINTSIRIVCWNTWSAAEAEGEKSGRTFSFRHTSSIRDRIEDARKVVLGAQSDTERWAEYATKMVAIPVTDQQVDKFLAEFVPMPPEGAISDRVAENVKLSRKQIRDYYHSASCASIAGTAWGLIQATGEYLDHGRTYKTKESYVGRQLLRPEKAKLQTIKMVEELVGAR